ncbi:hypothetical protein BXZ70DRAFT_6237 [Cristinia sonorae]|uniref:F-box domain-containing protein n=1 Tax=Cristinia sonorae TaxID=1940300 RepID=A0A8K0XUL4_9AGAR|nr:hypothetical protein BXZ70DRAFT_6237 [Cristinia sonorae]
MASFQGLPNELLESILLEADIQSIARCRQVSKTLGEIITNSKPIQYKIELAIDGFEDGPADFPWGTSERLDALRSRRLAWAKMQPMALRVINARTPKWQMASRNHITWIDDAAKFHVLQIPSVFRGIPEREWVIEPGVVNMVAADDAAVDPDEDLLVVLEKRGIRNWVLSLRSLSTGEYHPEAERSEIPVNDMYGSRTNGNGVRVFRDYMGIHFQCETTGKLEIYNWRTGKLILNLAMKPPFGYVFLSEEYLLIPHTDAEGGILSVFQIDDFGRAEERHIADLIPEIQLRLPKGKNPGSFGLELPQPRQWHKVKVPFHSGPDYLVAITAYYHAAALEATTVIIPVSTIRHLIAGERRLSQKPLEWFQWGTSGSRLIHTDPVLIYPQVNGMTAIIQQSHLDTKVTHLYNFGTLGYWKHLRDAAALRAPPEVQAHGVSWYHGSANFDDSPIMTLLLARRVRIDHWFHQCRPVDREDSRWVKDVLLGDDCIIVEFEVDPPHSHGHHQYQIFSF